MRIVRTNPKKNKTDKRAWYFIYFILYTTIIFIAGAFSYREGLIAKNQWIFSPFTETFRKNPLKTIVNKLKPITPLILDIDYVNYQKIKQTQKRAVKLNELFSSEGDWVKANLSYGKEKFKSDIRLKGQLNEHWSNDGLWSYKIKLKDNKTLFGMDRFAFQHPRTRSFLNEWYYHKLLNYVGVISLRYKFLPLIINGQVMPIYAIEENFSTRLLENNNRREGPIFKLKNRVSPQESSVNEISFYEKEKYRSTQKGNYLLRRVEGQINKFLSGSLKASEVFNVELMAKAYAISDLFGHDHPILAYNMRYYLNPITGLIEPVPYDQQEILSLNQKGLIGERNKHFENISLYSDNLIPLLFKDEKFSEEYGKALDLVSNKNWLDKFFELNEQESSEILSMLKRSYIKYEFKGKELFYENQNYIRSKLRVRSPAIAHILSTNNNQELKLKLNNLHTLPLEIKYLETAEGKKISSLIESKLITNRLKICFLKNCKNIISPKVGQSKIFNINLNDKIVTTNDFEELSLIGSVLGSKYNFSIPLFTLNEYKSGVNDLKNLKKLEFLDVNQKEKIISFRRGNINLEKNLIIPEGFILKISPGTNIDILKKGSILSYSPISFRGTEELPIEIRSSDLTGEGLLVINTKGSSKINNVIFKDLKPISKYGLNPTGSLTFYNADVDINKVRLESLQAEDSLNIVNSNFTIKNSEISNSLSDAIDFDFSNGNIDNLKFKNIGNDGLDFSGSISNIKNISIENVGDKGISIGENSEINIENISIKKSLIGIAVKDDSILEGSKLKINKSFAGLANYNKKDWFGGGKSILNKVSINDTLNKFINEKGSFMSINGKTIDNNQTNVFEKLYNKI